MIRPANRSSNLRYVARLLVIGCAADLLPRSEAPVHGVPPSSGTVGVWLYSAATTDREECNDGVDLDHPQA